MATLAAKFPECRIPEPERSVLRGSSSSNVKVILDTTSANSGLDANGWAKKVLLSGKVVFVERNCSKEPIYLKAAEEVEGLDDFENKQKVISTESSLSFCKNNRKPS
ncbi:hypothetical protein ACET3Z_027944 [Daucus carota]